MAWTPPQPAGLYHQSTVCLWPSQVHLPEADRQWVTRPSPTIEFWSGGSRPLWEGVEVLRLGGHFPGSSVLLWRGGAGGRGALFTGGSGLVCLGRHCTFSVRSALADGIVRSALGNSDLGHCCCHCTYTRAPALALFSQSLAGDTIFPVPDRGWVSFMLSFPNLVPLPAEQVGVAAAARGSTCLPASPGLAAEEWQLKNGSQVTDREPGCSVPSAPCLICVCFPSPVPWAQVRRISRALETHPFDRLHGPFPGGAIRQGAAEAVQRSAARYCAVLDGSTQRTYY